MFDPSRDGCAMLTKVAISTPATVLALASAFIKIKGLDLDGGPVSRAMRIRAANN